ncbi:MAG: hypothetical protein IJ358_02170 [Clostridia bacterium]|nr:hypothetical protein [Clostridia bacterium]
MKTILKIQELDRQIRKIKSGVDNSRESKLLVEFTKVMKEGRSFVNNIADVSDEIIKEFNEINRKYEMLIAKSEITAKHKPEMANIDSIGNLVDDANYLTSELAILEQRMRELTDKGAKLLNDYNAAMNKLKDTKAKCDALKDMIAKKNENAMPEIANIEAQIKKLEKQADSAMYEKYKSMLNDNIFPVFVHLKGNRCGGCQMEQSLNFIQKLKQKGMLPCEECRRIILADEQE